MQSSRILTALMACSLLCIATLASAEVADKNSESATSDAVCTGFGPQTPRDISNTEGLNNVMFELAPEVGNLNLCNIHTHTNAEHKGPGFSVHVGDDKNGGFACNDRSDLTKAMLKQPRKDKGAFAGVNPGDTIEVHWVYSSCDVEPGPGLGACLSDACANPQLRVEAQTFLVVNDPDALDFMDYAYAGNQDASRPQPKTLPNGTGTPVLFRGSTTGPSYTQSTCSPLQVTWNVRPQCARLDINALNRWAKSNNVFEETGSHGVRQLVTELPLLSEIKQ